ncbi:Na+/phosphate symporter [Lysinibacillus composti]|nr:Na+/phosphate symporter [Lysinibacillus composti]
MKEAKRKLTLGDWLFGIIGSGIVVLVIHYFIS